LLQSIKKIQEEFYSKSKKNIFIKKEQKIDCANSVNNMLSLEELTSKTFYLIPNTNRIFIDYNLFKLFAVPSNYQFIIDKFINLLKYTIKTYGTFEIHIDLKSFSASAAERFSKIFKLYYDTTCAVGLYYNIDHIDKICIYNTPQIINIISKLLINYTDNNIKTKITYFSKENSNQHIQNVFI